MFQKLMYLAFINKCCTLDNLGKIRVALTYKPAFLDRRNLAALSKMNVACLIKAKYKSYF